MTTVFISGPMFSVTDKAGQLAIGQALEHAGFECIVPHRDGVEVAPVMSLLDDPNIDAFLDGRTTARCIAWVTRIIACLDMYWATSSDVTVLNLDGRVPDEGSLVEATAAWLSGHPVIAYQTTPVKMLGKNNNPMIGVITDWTPVVNDLEWLVDQVRDASDTHHSPNVRLCPNKVAHSGKWIAHMLKSLFVSSVPIDVLQTLEPHRDLQPMCQYVVQQIMEFSKSETKEERDMILMEGLNGLRGWESTPDLEAALRFPIPC